MRTTRLALATWVMGLLATSVVPACKGVVVSAFPDKFVGVGLELTIRDNLPTVVRAIEGGAAASAGLMPEDRIVSIGDAATEGMALPDVVLRLRGEPGSTVQISILRNGTTLGASLTRQDMEKRGDGYVARTGR